jgi:hypothetical protein
MRRNVHVELSVNLSNFQPIQISSDGGSILKGNIHFMSAGPASHTSGANILNLDDLGEVKLCAKIVLNIKINEKDSTN